MLWRLWRGEERRGECSSARWARSRDDGWLRVPAHTYMHTCIASLVLLLRQFVTQGSFRSKKGFERPSVMTEELKRFVKRSHRKRTASGAEPTVSRRGD